MQSDPLRSEWPWSFVAAAVIEAIWLLLLVWMALAR
jgi:hypothetical protein